MKTYVPKLKDIKKQWYVIDAQNKVLGRLATVVASYLRGKHKPCFVPFMDVGDHIIVINSSKVKLTGRKLDQKIHYSHSGYPGGLKKTVYRKMLEKKPEKVIRLAVKRMLPKNKLGRKMLKKLRVYAGPEPPHEAQNPEKLDI